MEETLSWTIHFWYMYNNITMINEITMIILIINLPGRTPLGCFISNYNPTHSYITTTSGDIGGFRRFLRF